MRSILPPGSAHGPRRPHQPHIGHTSTSSTQHFTRILHFHTFFFQPTFWYHFCHNFAPFPCSCISLLDQGIPGVQFLCPDVSDARLLRLFFMILWLKKIPKDTIIICIYSVIGAIRCFWRLKKDQVTLIWEGGRVFTFYSCS